MPVRRPSTYPVLRIFFVFSFSASPIFLFGGKEKVLKISVLRTSDADSDPSKDARAARKERMAKNERQHIQNLARAQQGRGREQATDTKMPTRVERTKEIERRLVTTRASTASMGKFDRRLEGEKKPRGLKRKVRVNVVPLLQISSCLLRFV
jgi:hypothetical protein